MKIVFILSFFTITPNAFAEANFIHFDSTEKVVDYGIGFGSAIAIVISWSRNRSVVFAVIHGLLGWLYIIYYLITKQDRADD